MFAICAPIIAASSVNLLGAPNPPLKLVRSIPVPGMEEGDFDHFGIDLNGGRLFSCAEKNGTVEVFDLRTYKHIYSIGKGVLQEPHSLFYREDLDRLFV